ncbi:uncharacterized protein in LEU2 3'region-like [Lytechinus variegatus]|uniref:uncharacterized protein in LEU2 3'region-like n=1 Tax=Lytechinus variegatus TaxID=7654 RepID=UPI001BB13750|nr:uncharacterized protein in LEU2 3'region-like [Lytechinus variegatus]
MCNQRKVGGSCCGGINLLITLLLTCLTTSSSAAFFEITSLRLGDASGVWRGVPEVYVNTGTSLHDRKNAQICMDDTYWNTEIADAICQYHGFESYMVIKETTPPAQGFFLDGYAVCNKIDNSNRPLECELRETCDNVPTISCKVPGYDGCYNETDTDPFFSNGVKADLGDQSLDIQTCASACSDSSYLGLTKGQDCICGSTLGDRSLEGDCDLGCQGDDLQICGGSNSISVYNVDTLGRCNSDPVDLIPDELLFITSPGFPGAATTMSCTWEVSINVQTLHDLEVVAVASLASGNQLHITSQVIRVSLNGGNARSRVSRKPYDHLQDTITVTYSALTLSGSTNFNIKFSLTASTSLPTNMTNIPTNIPVVDSTTSSAGRTFSSFIGN